MSNLSPDLSLAKRVADAEKRVNEARDAAQRLVAVAEIAQQDAARHASEAKAKHGVNSPAEIQAKAQETYAIDLQRVQEYEEAVERYVQAVAKGQEIHAANRT